MPGIIVPGTPPSQYNPAQGGPSAERAYTATHTVQHSPQSAKEAQYTAQHTGQVKPAAVAAGNTMTAAQVRAMQQFLVNHGFQVSIDGVNGPLTKSAAAAFRANHGAGDVWSAKHGIGVHPGTKPMGTRSNNGFRTANLGGGAPGYPDTSGAAGSHAGGGGLDPGTAGTAGAGADPYSGAYAKLLGQLLASGGTVGTGLDPRSFGGAAAAPDLAKVKADLAAINLNPKQEAQNQADLSSWYGLNPNDPNYGISVLGRLATAGQRDQTAASNAASSDTGIAKALAASLGGSANDASGSVLAAGAEQAGTANALGAAQAQYANDMNPLIAAEARGQMSREKAANAQTLLGLRTQMAGDQGQAVADRAAGVASAVDKNNALDQQRFANRGNLLSILTQAIASDPNNPQNAIKLALAGSEIGANNARAIHYLTPSGSKNTKPAPGSFQASSATDRAHFAAALQSAISDKNGKLLPGMTKAKAWAISQRLAHLYFPNGGIPNGTGVISGIIANAGL